MDSPSIVTVLNPRILIPTPLGEKGAFDINIVLESVHLVRQRDIMTIVAPTTTSEAPRRII